MNCTLNTQDLFYKLKQEEQPQCIAWQSTYTVKHVLIECTDLSLIRQPFFILNNMNNPFYNVDMYDIFYFSREKYIPKIINKYKITSL